MNSSGKIHHVWRKNSIFTNVYKLTKHDDVLYHKRFLPILIISLICNEYFTYTQDREYGPMLFPHFFLWSFFSVIYDLTCSRICYKNRSFHGEINNTFYLLAVNFSEDYTSLKATFEVGELSSPDLATLECRTKRLKISVNCTVVIFYNKNPYEIISYFAKVENKMLLKYYHLL